MKRTFPEKIQSLKKLCKERLLPGAKSILNDGKNIFLDKENSSMQAYLTRPKINISSESKKYFSQIQQNSLSVLLGRNNSGKSLLLKKLKEQIGPGAHIISVNRYQNFSVISEFSPNENEKEELHNSFMQQIQQPQNFENVLVSLPQVFGKLHKDKVVKLYELMDKFFDIKLDSKNIVEGYPFSQRYLDCDGSNLVYMSSGFRLCLYLLAVMLDDTFDTFLIDEPELGISPELQGKLADLFLSQVNWKEHFPHIKQLILVTHSSVFLDTQDIGNNYKIEKIGNDLSIFKTKDRIQFYDIASFLGNRFETLGLPSVIICVEGETDEQYLQKVVKLRFTNLRVSVLDSSCYENSKGGESKISGIIRVLNKFVGEFQDSPYRNRIFILVDSSFKKKDKERIIGKGVLNKNFNILSQNGIEYYYPQKILDQIFMTTHYQVNFNSKGEVFFGGVVFSKVDLNKKVIDLLKEDTEYPQEFEVFLKKFESL